MRLFHTTWYPGLCILTCNLAATLPEDARAIPRKGVSGFERQVRTAFLKGEVPWAAALRRRFPMKVLMLLLLLFSVTLCAAEPARAPQRLKSLSLEQLGNLDVTTVSTEPVEVWDTLRVIYVITQGDIRDSGATSLPELLRIIPGLQVTRMQSDNSGIGYQAMDAHLTIGEHLTMAANGRNPLQPRHREFTGNNGNAVGIRRNRYASLAWRP